jgi:hypothetical protein
MLLGYYHEEKLVGVCFNYPASAYMNLEWPECPKSKMVQIIAPFVEILEDEMKRSIVERNEMHKTFIGDWIAISPDMQ